MVIYSSKGEGSLVCFYPRKVSTYKVFLLRINAEIEGLGMLTSIAKFAVYGNDW